MSFSTKKCLLNASAKLSLFLLIFLTFNSCSLKASEIRSVGYFPNEGIKAFNGSSWKNFNEGLPADLVAENITADSKGTFYLTTEYSGIFKRDKDSDKWELISSPLLKRRTQLADVHEFRRISSFCIDPKNDNVLYAGTKHTLYSSVDAGKTWKQILIQQNKNSYYFTSLFVVNEVLYAGTSFDGILRIQNGIAQQINNGIPKDYYAGTMHFCEGVSALSEKNGVLFSGFLFGRGFAESADGKNWRQIVIPFKKDTTESVYGIVPFNNRVIITTDEALYEYNPADRKILLSPIDAIIKRTVGDKEPTCLFVKASDSNPALFIRKNISSYTVEKNNRAGNKRALYVSWSMLNSNFNKFLDIVVRTKSNAVIIDVKDDFGIINAPIESKVASEIGAIRKTNIKEIIAKLHAKGIYVIARNVTFKDKKLYFAYNSKYAIWDKVSNEAWVGLPRERWCDPYSAFVRQYNIDIAKETAKLGVD
ncbi:MAG TPA: putative glycoside hydrolase, partial [Spirochaetota bacterium]